MEQEKRPVQLSGVPWSGFDQGEKGIGSILSEGLSETVGRVLQNRLHLAGGENVADTRRSILRRRNGKGMGRTGRPGGDHIIGSGLKEAAYAAGIAGEFDVALAGDFFSGRSPLSFHGPFPIGDARRSFGQ